MSKDYAIGLDYGTDSVRALIVDTNDGREIASSVHDYRRWAEGKYCDPGKNMFRQHPLDYLEGLENAIAGALRTAPPGTADKIAAISVDTTGSTPVAVDSNGVALALKDEFMDNPNAMFVLWKDHTAIKEAEEINNLAREWEVDYTKYCGGVYSAEWFWAKILHILRDDPAVCGGAFSWVEHCDWIPAVLTGNTSPLEMKRSRCAAGHKAMWHEEFGGLPSNDFLKALDPLLDGLRPRLFSQTHTADMPVGTLTKEWADKLGLDENVVVGVGAFDAHMGAVGGAIEPGALIKVMGTSTCDMLVAPMEEVGDKLVAGICGQVDGSILPGMLGLEAGQSAFGDLYAWFRRLLAWPLQTIVANTNLIDKASSAKIVKEAEAKILSELGEEAAKLPVGSTGVVALDWINGRRTPYANQKLKSAISGLNMGSDAPAIFRALVEATAFGAKKIIDRFEDEGIHISQVIALGGVAKKSDFVMNVVADVLGIEIKVVESEQACALGAAMFAATAAGIHKSVFDAQKAMASGFHATYSPNMDNHAEYKKLYAKYDELGNYMSKSVE